MPKIDKADRRDKKRWKAQHGMRVVGRSVRDVLAGLMGWGSGGSSSGEQPRSSESQAGSARRAGRSRSRSEQSSSEQDNASTEQPTNSDTNLDPVTLAEELAGHKLICPLCEEPVMPGEELADSTVNTMLTHRECLLRSITGGIEHLTAPLDHKVGTCYNNSHLTYRESAQAAAAWVEEHGIEAAFEWKGDHRDPMH